MRRRNVLVAIVLLAAVVLGVRWLRRERPSEEERVKALFTAAALAAEERRTAELLEPISARFSGPDGLDQQGVKRFLLAMVLRGEWVAVQVAGIAVAVEGDRARATVDVVTARSGKGRAVADLLPQEAAAHRIACRLERESGDWRIVGAAWTPITLGEALAGPPAP
jgi:hypothetical protein